MSTMTAPHRHTTRLLREPRSQRRVARWCLMMERGERLAREHLLGFLHSKDDLQNHAVPWWGVGS